MLGLQIQAKKEQGNLASLYLGGAGFGFSQETH
jgi:hypothetical protein